jgi:hypothetical protein
MPFRDLIINVDSEGLASIALLENNLQYIKERIAYAQRLTKPSVKLMIDGSSMDRLVWIAEAEIEQAKIEAELGKLKV